MKKILASLVFLAVTAPAFAHHGGVHVVKPGQHHIWHKHRHHWHHNHHNNNWVVPLVIGGAITYSLTRPEPIIIRDQPIIVEQSTEIVPGTNCTAWREIQQPDGTIVRERTCRQ